MITLFGSTGEIYMMVNPHIAGIKLVCFMCKSDIAKGDPCSKVSTNIGEKRKTLYRCNPCDKRLFPVTG